LEPGEGLCSLVAEHDGGLTPRMLPYHQYPIPQREPLLRIIRNRRIQTATLAPANMLIRLIPHLDAKGEVAGDVVEIGIGQLPQQFIHSEVRFRASAP
jgi:hypothetical protein